jgi:hypothetical protein
MDCLANAPDLSDESIGIEPPPLSAEVVATSSSEIDLPLWFGSLLSRTAEARAQRLNDRKTSPLPWRSVVSRWPIARRQEWGDRANRLQDAGLEWKEAERLAFDELKPLDRARTEDLRHGS